MLKHLSALSLQWGLSHTDPTCTQHAQTEAVTSRPLAARLLTCEFDRPALHCSHLCLTPILPHYLLIAHSEHQTTQTIIAHMPHHYRGFLASPPCPFSRPHAPPSSVLHAPSLGVTPPRVCICQQPRPSLCPASSQNCLLLLGRALWSSTEHQGPPAKAKPLPICLGHRSTHYKAPN